MRRVVVEFQVHHDDEENLAFLEALDLAWRTGLANPGERYRVTFDSAAPAPSTERST